MGGMGGFGGLDEEQEENADLDELELLSDAVMAFESVAFETKKKVNALDRLTFKSQLLPPTLKLCFQALMKSWMQGAKDKSAKTDFDSENLEAQLADAVKQSSICIKEFSKFKGEFFALNEPIINKDISNLSLTFVNSHIAKLQAQTEKLALIEDRVSQNDGHIEELKNKFETFQTEKFEEKLNTLQKEGQEVKEIIAELDEKDEKSLQLIKDAQKVLSETRAQTKEQRAKHSEVTSRLQKNDRKYQKWKANFIAQSSKQAELHEQIDSCQKIVENLEELVVKNMVTQSKKLQKLVDCSLASTKFKSKMQGLLDELEQIYREN